MCGGDGAAACGTGAAHRYCLLRPENTGKEKLIMQAIQRQVAAMQAQASMAPRAEGGGGGGSGSGGAGELDGFLDYTEGTGGTGLDACALPGIFDDNPLPGGHQHQHPGAANAPPMDGPQHQYLQHQPQPQQQSQQPSYLAQQQMHQGEQGDQGDQGERGAHEQEHLQLQRQQSLERQALWAAPQRTPAMHHMLHQHHQTQFQHLLHRQRSQQQPQHEQQQQQQQQEEDAEEAAAAERKRQRTAAATAARAAQVLAERQAAAAARQAQEQDLQRLQDELTTSMSRYQQLQMYAQNPSTLSPEQVKQLPVALHQYQVKILTVQEQIRDMQKQIQAAAAAAAAPAAAAARAPQQAGAAARGTKRSAEERDAEKAQRAAEKVSHPTRPQPTHPLEPARPFSANGTRSNGTSERKAARGSLNPNPKP